jgi:iron uptake system component EfeO
MRLGTVGKPADRCAMIPGLGALSARKRYLQTQPRRAGISLGVMAVTLVLAVAAASVALASTSDDAIESYRASLANDISQALAEARALRDRIDAHDVAGAQKAWIEARVGWERSEVFTAGFVPDLDSAIDAWPDAASGFHGIEAKLFGADMPDVRSETDDLIGHLAALDTQVRNIKLTGQGLLNGIARLVYEVGDSKVEGGESRFSGTSLNDMRNNVEGIALAYRTLFASSLEAADAKLAARVDSEIDALKHLVAARDLKSVDPDALRKASEALIVSLQAAGPRLGLAAPSLEETVK